MSNDARIPDFVREFLLYKGFNTSLKAFDLDVKNEKDKGFRVDKIMEQIHFYVNTHDIVNLKDFWNFLDSRFFTRVSYHFTPGIKRLESGLLKVYLVNCVQTNKSDRVMEFFEKLGPELQGQSDWKEWFSLPFTRNPEENSVFAVYFTKQWQDTFYLSLHNLLSVIIQTSPVPKPLNMDEEVKKIKRLQDENQQLRNQIAQLMNDKESFNIPTPTPMDSLADSILSPTGLPGPSAMDLMDDFYVISQETVIEESSKQLQQQPQAKSQPIKSFIKNIGRSASPANDTKKQQMLPDADNKRNIATVDNQTNNAQYQKTHSSGFQAGQVVDKNTTLSSSKVQSAASAAAGAATTSSVSNYNRSKSEPANTILKNTSALSVVKPRTTTGIPIGNNNTQGNKLLAASSKSDRPRSLDGSGSIASVNPPSTSGIASQQPVNAATLARQSKDNKSSIPSKSKLKKPEVVKKIPVSILANTSTSTSNHSSHSKEPSHHNAPPEPHNPRLVTTTGNDMLDNSRNSRAMEINTAKSPYLLLSQEEYGEHRSPLTHCRFSNTSHSVATLDADGVVKVWSLQPSPVTIATVMSKSMLLSLEWASKLDKYLLLGSKAGSVRLFDITNKKIEKEANVDQSFNRVNSLCCNPQGTHFACCSSGKVKPQTGPERPGKLTLWELETMTCLRSLVLGQVPVTVNCTCYSRSGRLLLTGTADGWIRLYAPESDKDGNIGSWCAHQGEVYSLCFSLEENSCYSMGADGKLIEWSLTKFGERLADLQIHPGASGPFVRSEPGGFRQVQTPKGKLFALDYSDGSKHLLTCSQNGGILYQISNKTAVEPVMALGGHKTPVVTLDMTPCHDTKMCLTGSMDGKVRVSTLLNQ